MSDLTLNKLKEDGYKAAFVGIGIRSCKSYTLLVSICYDSLYKIPLY